MTDDFSVFTKRIATPVNFRLFTMRSLPSAWLAGLHIEQLSQAGSAVSMRYKWFTKNPFRSVYFAILAMAAEVSTGVLCMGHLYKKQPRVSMLVVKMEAQFLKKATGKIVFSCTEGLLVKDAVEKAITSGKSVEVECLSTGKNEQEETVAIFRFTWSFKAKAK